MSKGKWGVGVIKEKTVREKTGKGWKEWFTILDNWGAQDKRHSINTQYLIEEFGLSSWWANAITFRYEWEKRAEEQTS